FYCLSDCHSLHSFPTRRSSDLSFMDIVQYDFSYMFYYSERPGTLAAKKFADDIPLDTKKRRLQEIIEKQNTLSLKRNQMDVGKIDRKSTRLNSSHVKISYAVFC